MENVKKITGTVYEESDVAPYLITLHIAETFIKIDSPVMAECYNGRKMITFVGIYKDGKWHFSDIITGMAFLILSKDMETGIWNGPEDPNTPLKIIWNEPIFWPKLTKKFGVGKRAA